MNNTHPLARRIAAGVGISLFSTLALAAFMAPGGAFEGRATSLRIDEPEVTTTTTMTPAPVELPAPAPVEIPTTTTTAPPAAVPAPETTPTTEIGQAVTITKPQSGHFVCPGGMDATTQYGPGLDCRADVVVDPGPAITPADPTLTNGADGDQPGHTLGSTDPAYGADLTAKSCAIKPWLCGDGWTD